MNRFFRRKIEVKTSHLRSNHTQKRVYKFIKWGKRRTNVLKTPVYSRLRIETKGPPLHKKEEDHKKF